MSKILMNDVKITDQDISSVNTVLQSTIVSSLSPVVREFEEDFAYFVNKKYAVAVSNGTVALHLLLHTLGIGPGTSVIVPNLTFVASANAVLYTGAELILAPVDENGVLKIGELQDYIRHDTKVVMAVNIYGNIASSNELKKICQEKNVVLIEDSAESLGNEFFHGEAAYSCAQTYSLYANKIITSGEGGMITTNNKKLYQRLQKLRDHAMSQAHRYYHSELGFNFRMTGLQAALGKSQLSNISHKILVRKKIYQKYRACMPNIVFLNKEENVNWLTTILLPTEELREKIEVVLEKNCVEYRRIFYPMSELPYTPACNCKFSTLLFNTGLSLPTHEKISDKQIAYISKLINGVVN